MPYLTLDSTYDYLESIDPDFMFADMLRRKNIPFDRFQKCPYMGE